MRASARVWVPAVARVWVPALARVPGLALAERASVVQERARRAVAPVA